MQHFWLLLHCAVSGATCLATIHLAVARCMYLTLCAMFCATRLATALRDKTLHSVTGPLSTLYALTFRHIKSDVSEDMCYKCLEASFAQACREDYIPQLLFPPPSDEREGNDTCSQGGILHGYTHHESPTTSNPCLPWAAYAVTPLFFNH